MAICMQCHSQLSGVDLSTAVTYSVCDYFVTIRVQPTKSTGSEIEFFFFYDVGERNLSGATFNFIF